ncbi:MAG: malic enzyme-like NAD(P)-binding protein [archaeon]|nr:malate dehydrogenase [Nanoarchaeota archaeon]
MKNTLEYHSRKPAGKIAVIPTKPCTTADELSLAYTPGVADPCLEIKNNPNTVYDYTAKGNLVAVISNGSAVLGLGNIGALAGKPVMEGKGVLFKRFANVDVFDIEIAESDPEKFVSIVTSLEPTFGGINLEDIKAPDCFYIEEQLIEKMNIPIFHDDQHGTAVIVSAALINALTLVKKKLDNIKIVFSGAGSAAIACAKLLLSLGAHKKNIFMFDSKGLLTKEQKLNPYKAEFAQDQESVSLTEALQGSDVFIGVSKGGIVSTDMVKSMASPPIVFALANPVPEISYDEVKAVIPDAIVATGRSDFPNQVNNVLCFPFLFRGALDVRASAITLNMKLAAVHALADLTKEPVLLEVEKIYSEKLSFGNNYIIPKPFDPRILSKMAVAVAKAAMEDGVARKEITDLEGYEKDLEILGQKIAKGIFF